MKDEPINIGAFQNVGFFTIVQTPLVGNAH